MLGNFLTRKVRGAGVYILHLTSYTKGIIYSQPYIAFGGCPHSGGYPIINTQLKISTPDFLKHLQSFVGI
jgi:hypothetical protein